MQATLSSAIAAHFLSALHALGERLVLIGHALLKIFTDPGSQFSIWSLGCALLASILFIAHRQHRRGRPFRLRPILRVVLPRRLVRGASTRADAGFFLLNNFAAGALIGWALLSFATIGHAAQFALTAVFGPAHPRMAPLPADILQTAAMFLAYEFAYWLDHWLKHEVPFLWEFHRVHHTAETLTPATVYRVHPIDTLVFYNMAVVIMAVANAATGQLTGQPGHGITVGGSNILVLAGVFMLGNLQHSHMWIAFTGRLGHVLLSPAHHQIHHSADPGHYGKNLGSSLAIFDTLFGTLLVPEKRRQKLVFGVSADPGERGPHTITGALVTPFVRAAAAIRPAPRPIAGSQDGALTT
jgi:sterol desaturase/sphingolipid hydroxylase (fatty acid hydroxylase superfamily)